MLEIYNDYMFRIVEDAILYNIKTRDKSPGFYIILYHILYL